MTAKSQGGLSLSMEGATAVLTLDRPDKRNALGVDMWRGLPRLLEQARARAETRILLLRGAGGNFAAGADIGEFDTVFASRQTTLAYAGEMAAATAALETFPLPVIAWLEGLCIGAGVAVALACDIRIAAADARFAVTPAKLGLMYSLADTKRLVDSVGPSAAKDLLFTGRMLDARSALAIGLVTDVADPMALESVVRERAALICDASPWSAAKAKSVVRLVVNGMLRESGETRAWFADAVETDDYREGLAAFREKRKAKFPPR